MGASQERPEPGRHGAGLKLAELCRINFVFALAPGHSLAATGEPLAESELKRHRQIVVADSSQRLAPRATGLTGSETLIVPSMAAKIAAQKAGLGVGFLPEHGIRAELASGALVTRETEAGKPDGLLQLAWRASHRGRALNWWIERLSSSEWRTALTA